MFPDYTHLRLERGPECSRLITNWRDSRCGLPQRALFKMPDIVTYHSALAPEAVKDTLLRSVSTQGVPPYLGPWFYRLIHKDNTCPIWGVVESGKFRLLSNSGGIYAPYFYATWEPQYGGTRIVGYFDLGPSERSSPRIALVFTLAAAALGISLNALDLTCGTHFTKDPEVGTVISVLLVPFGIGFQRLMYWLGARADKRVLAFLESTLAATRAS